jgi:hypothetical protein
VSGAFPVARPHQLDYTLRESESERRVRAQILGAIYALCDPAGWDGRKLGLTGSAQPAGRDQSWRYYSAGLQDRRRGQNVST